jgi:glycosyltransferase involved in cell wall biosynthesis
MKDDILTKFVRSDFMFDQWHKAQWRDKSITAVVCERDTADVTKLMLESLLHFYPDLPILIVDGGSKDDSINYVRYKARTLENVNLWERVGRNGHGQMLHEAITSYINTEYVLLLDSDIVVMRGGWIEEMLERLRTSDLYGIGSLLFVTQANDGCGEPLNEQDILRYLHPSCSMIKRDQYLKLQPFIEHGAPLVYNMKDAQRRDMKVEGYPVEKYVLHLSGASYTEPRTTWRWDHGVLIRPFFTFICDLGSADDFLHFQLNKDFEIVMSGQNIRNEISIYRKDGTGYDSTAMYNNLYQLRFHVHGEYVCRLPNDVRKLHEFFLSICKGDLIGSGMPDEYEQGGLKFVKRELWQSRDAIS